MKSIQKPSRFRLTLGGVTVLLLIASHYYRKQLEGPWGCRVGFSFWGLRGGGAMNKPFVCGAEGEFVLEEMPYPLFFCPSADLAFLLKWTGHRD